MKTARAFVSIVGICVLLFGFGHELFAGEAPVEVIDKTNWEKAEGLVPAALLEWIKKGEWTLPVVSEIHFNEKEFFPDYALKSFTENVGKYELDENGIIVDAKTGEMAKMIIGFPFPKVDPEDPKAAIKIMYNKQYVTYILGFKRFTTTLTWVGKNTGYERDIEAYFRDAYLTGFPGAKAYRNPRDVERYSIISVRKPYDLAGTSVMLWRYLSAKADVNFSYIPAIRRVRRTTPANRSDGFVGSDFSVDDILAYDGKIPDFDFRLIRKQEALVPFASPDTIGIEVTEEGEWEMAKDRPHLRYGYHDKEGQRAPWAPVSSIYTKRDVWVIEARSKDPYYNYGTQYMWVLTDTWGPTYKTVHDRGDKFWKFMSVDTAGYQTKDETVKFVSWLDHVIVDPRRDHGTIITLMRPETLYVINAELDLNDFSLGGFQKYCK